MYTSGVAVVFVCICRVVPSSLKLPLSEASEAPCRSTNIRRTEAEIDRAKYSGSDREKLDGTEEVEQTKLKECKQK